MSIALNTKVALFNWAVTLLWKRHKVIFENLTEPFIHQG